MLEEWILELNPGERYVSRIIIRNLFWKTECMVVKFTKAGNKKSSEIRGLKSCQPHNASLD